MIIFLDSVSTIVASFHINSIESYNMDRRGSDGIKLTFFFQEVFFFLLGNSHCSLSFPEETSIQLNIILSLKMFYSYFKGDSNTHGFITFLHSVLCYFYSMLMLSKMKMS